MARVVHVITRIRTRNLIAEISQRSNVDMKQPYPNTNDSLVTADDITISQTNELTIRSLGPSLPLSPNLHGFAHEIRVPNHFRSSFRRRITSHEQRKTIDQPSPTPVDQLLTQTMQAILLAQRAKYFGCHAGIAMVRPVENFRFNHVPIWMNEGIKTKNEIH